MDRKNYYLLWILGAGFFAISVLYIEYVVLSAALETGELKYVLSKYKVVLFGKAAVFAHIANIGFGILGAALAYDAYAKYQR